MLNSSEEAIIEYALQVLALLVSLGRGGEIPPVIPPPVRWSEK